MQTKFKKALCVEALVVALAMIASDVAAAITTWAPVSAVRTTVAQATEMPGPGVIFVDERKKRRYDGDQRRFDRDRRSRRWESERDRQIDRPWEQRRYDRNREQRRADRDRDQRRFDRDRDQRRADRDRDHRRWESERDRRIDQNWHRDWDRPRYKRGYRGSRVYRRGYRRDNDGWWYPLAAFALGAIILNQQNQRVPSPQTNRIWSHIPAGNMAAHDNWCAQRYRSYDRASKTFQPYNGPRKYCNSPYDLL